MIKVCKINKLYLFSKLRNYLAYLINIKKNTFCLKIISFALWIVRNHPVSLNLRDTGVNSFIIARTNFYLNNCNKKAKKI